MKHCLKIAFVALAFMMVSLSAKASLYDITPDMQTCASDTDCTAIPDSCTKACETLPVNAASAERLKASRVHTCSAEAVEKLPACEIHPPLEPRCVNNRCTVGFAFDNNADDKDYGRRSGGSPSKKAASAGPASGYDDGPGVLQLPEGYKPVPAENMAPAAAAPQAAPLVEIPPMQTQAQAPTAAQPAIPEAVPQNTKLRINSIPDKE